MLTSLHIQDYALIDSLAMEFGPGFNVLTGETGAGKSIIAGALNLVLGARASSEMVRDGAKRARIDAVFHIAKPSRRLKALLDECAVQLEDGDLFVSRTVSADGRSRALAGGAPVPVSVLARIGDELVDLHGQHEHQSLLKTDRQLDLLDAFGGTEDDASALGDQVAHLRALEKDLAELETDDRERARRVEFLRFEANEIQTAALEPGEEEELKGRRNLIANAERVHELTAHAQETLYEAEEGSAIDAIDAALRDVEELVGIDGQFQPFADQLGEARATVEAVASELRGHNDELDFDPAELETLNQRLALIGDLRRKYGDSVEAILAYLEKALAEIANYDQRDERLAALQRERAELLKKAEAAAEALSKKRKAAARKLDKQITAALQDLGMKGGQFETRFERGDLTASGMDRVAFMLAANPGEKLKPLRQVASGGEISRVMLGLKSVFAYADRIPTLIFDEIDAGVGGAVAKKVAAKLTALAESHQVICISHLAQIAAASATHFHVSKASSGKRTATTVTRVEDTARVEELARLLDGSVSDVSLEHARALLGASGE